jgi:PAS domain S-box-containing protein
MVRVRRLSVERDLAESRAHLAELSAANEALRRVNAELEASRAALARSEAKLRLALDAARMATWEWDVEGDATRGSPNREALYGAPPGSLRSLGDVLAVVHPDDRAAAAATVDRAFRRQPGEEEFDAVEFRVSPPGAAVRWLRAQGRVTARDPRTGEARHAAGVTFDVTDRRAAEQAAARASAEVRAVYDSVPVGLALLDREGRFVSLNARLAALLGAAEALPGEALEDALPAEAAAVVRSAHRRAVADGTAVTGVELQCESHAAHGDPRCWVVNLQPILTEPEEGAGVLAVSLMVEDVTERRRAEARRDLLAREVDHRARNALAVVLAAVKMTRADTASAFARAIEGRIAAVARAQGLLADRQWSGAAIRSLVEGSLAVFAPDGAAGGRVRLDGPELTLAAVAVQPFSMALHELATNAAKHGAFASAGGRVSVAWRLDRAAGVLRLRWSETGGPPLAGAPARTGFGSRVIRATIRDQLGGQVEQDWSGGGLVCDIALPAARVVLPAHHGNSAGQEQARLAAPQPAAAAPSI